MTDTPPQIAAMVRERLMALSGEERFRMGCRSFDAARDMVLASLPADLPPEEFKRRLFQRIYGYPLPPDFFQAPEERNICRIEKIDFKLRRSDREMTTSAFCAPRRLAFRLGRK